MLSGSSPDSRVAGATVAGTRGVAPSTAATIALMCSGVVPQQPPSRLTRPDSTNSPTIEAIWSAVWSYSPNSLGRPALG